jgi:hypothetical protein
VEEYKRAGETMKTPVVGEMKLVKKRRRTDASKEVELLGC